MAIRIRVQPQYGATGMMGTNALTANRLYQQQLKTERGMNNMRLQYERQLWGQKMQQAQLAAQLQYGGYAGGMTPGAVPYVMHPGLIGAGMLAQPPAVMPGMGMGMGLGHGQVNVTNQQAAGAANQSVSNSNTYHNYVMPGMGSFGGGFPFGGGWLGNLLGGGRWF